MAIIKDLNDFLRVHGILLASAGIPASLHQQLFQKLSGAVFDGGDFFRIEICEQGKQRRLLLSADRLAKFSRVFLVDHAWSFRLTEARKQLQEFPGLAERMSTLMCVAGDLENENSGTILEGDEVEVLLKRKVSVEDIIVQAKLKAKEDGGDVLWLELDELQMDDRELTSLDLLSNFPSLVGLSLRGNVLESEDVILQTICGLKGLRALWLNANPVDKKVCNHLQVAVFKILPHLEIYNGKFTSSYTKWAVAYCSGVYDCVFISHSFRDEPMKEVKSLDLSNRKIHSLLAKVFNPGELPLLAHLNLVGNPLDHDTQYDLFQVLRSLVNLQSLQIDVPGPLGRDAEAILEGLPQLCELNGPSVVKILDEKKNIVVDNLKPALPEWGFEEPLVERVLRSMWKFLMTYRLADEVKLDETPIWYIMDELGSALRHSDEPNFRVAPFLFMSDGTLESAISYSLLWPVQDVEKGEECTRDYLPGVGEENQRSARLTAWFHTPMHYFEEVYRKSKERFQNSSLNNSTVSGPPTHSIFPEDGCPFTVYTDIPQVQETLSRPEFILCDDASDADIVWTSMQIDEEIKRALDLKDCIYTNQFPFEACLVMKHHLADTVQQAFGAPVWFPTTYNMESDLASLIGDYSLREKEGRNNLWIVKPWNMARTIDTTITGHLPALIRLMETGPKICQKYIECPVLFKGKKFDLRYIVLLRSVQPLELFLSDVFWARLANKDYTLDEDTLTDYETHFTVMNYGRRLTHINTHEFVAEFEREHRVKWLDVHQRIRHMIRSIFEGAAALHPEMHCTTSRAMYGVDVMLDTSLQPKLLEVTYCPDCMRACRYDMQKVLGDSELMKGTEFFNDVFGCLFLDSYRHCSPL
eukprot:c26826_g1_i1 orf=394-2997(-)